MNTKAGDFKKEKDTQIVQINAEIKKYDLDEMKTDITYKMSTILNTLKKDQRQIMGDENRNLRQLDKIEHMQKALHEDYSAVQISLEAADKLKQRTTLNFEAIEKENAEEKKKMET